MVPKSLLRKGIVFKKYSPDVVHLGNIGLDKGGKTRAYSERYPHKTFFGIDLNPNIPEDRLANWQQHVGDFVSGLKQVRDNSVKVISSELAFGHYGKDWKSPISVEYNAQILNLAYRKLRPGGKIIIVVAGIYESETIKKAFARTKFKIDSITPISAVEASRTKYMRNFYDRPDEYGANGVYLQIVATK